MSRRTRLRTARLDLRPLTAGDEAAVVAGLNDLAVTRWLSVVPWPYASQDFRDFLPRAEPSVTFAMDDAQGFVGVMDTRGQLGYWLLPRAQGQGYATEGARAALHAHFDAGAGDIRSGYFEGNIASARVLAKLGFTMLARDRLFNRALGEERPHVALCLTRDAFRAVADSAA